MLASHTRRLWVLSVLGALVAAASIPAAASAAAQRYASPAGSGTACTSASPCGITQAVSGASAGDEVIVNPGDYALTATLATNANLPITIHGVAGQPRPRLLFSGPGEFGLRVNGATLRYVEVDQASPQSALFADYGASVDQVIAKAQGDSGVVTATIRNATIRNSIVVASGANAEALETGASAGTVTATYRNVTAVATGTGAVPIHALADTGASATIHLVNVIAYGGPGALSLSARTDSSGATAIITATHTDYQSANGVGSNATIVDGGGNRAEEPAFVNVAAGDYHQAPFSYTIDAGVNDPANGTVDVDGDARTNATTDIGADEFLAAPDLTTGPAGAVGAQSATSTAPTPPPVFAGVRLESTRLSFARGFIAVTLRCQAGTVGRCSGKTRLTARRRATSSRSATTVTLGRAAFSIAAGKQARARVRVSRAGRRLLNRARRLPGRDTNAARDGAGQSRTTVAAVTIRRRRG